MLLDEIDAIARDKENIYHNIAQARQAIKEIFYFTYCDSPLDLPTRHSTPQPLVTSRTTTGHAPMFCLWKLPPWYAFLFLNRIPF